MRRFRCTLAALLANASAMLTAPAAGAQDLSGALDLGQLGATIGVSNAMRGQVARKPRSAPHRVAPAKTMKLSSAAMTFRADPARQSATVTKWLTRIGKVDPKSAQQIRVSFQRQTLSGMAGPWLGRFNMRIDNGADAAAAYLSTAWLISRGDSGDPSRAQITGLRDQLARAMSSAPGWMNANDALKQEFADTLLLQATVNGALLEGAKQDPQRVRTVASAVARGAESAFGIDIRRLDLTSHGLVQKD